MKTEHRTETSDVVPADYPSASLVGRIWRPDVRGPSIVVVRGESILDVSSTFPTMRDLCEERNPAAAVADVSGELMGSVIELLENSSSPPGDPQKPWLLAPIDLQAIKAAGVTFVTSLLERVVEEKTRGDAQASSSMRHEIQSFIGQELQDIRPGSSQAVALKQLLMKKGMWSQYMDVGIGPDAELFTKAQPMSAIGHGQDAGFLSTSSWNNPEPEVVLVVSGAGEIQGATLGNDVNLRDVEGRSALLLGRAKDNNASCALGPFIRLFDSNFSLDHVRRMEVHLTVDGEEGFHLQAVSSLSLISRDPSDLVMQSIGPHHQYPDGFALFLGTMFAPVDDRDAPGMGFRHKKGDVVKIHSEKLGSLVNRMRETQECEPWTFGVSHLMRNLANRGLI